MVLQEKRRCKACPAEFAKESNRDKNIYCPVCRVREEEKRIAKYARERSERRLKTRNRRLAARRSWRRRKIDALPKPRCECGALLPKKWVPRGRQVTLRAKRRWCEACSERRKKAKAFARDTAARLKQQAIRAKHDAARPRTCKDCPAKLRRLANGWPERCPDCKVQYEKVMKPIWQRKSMRKKGLSDAMPRERWLGQSAKRTLKYYPGCRLSPSDLFNEGWLAAREYLLAGETFKVAHRRAEARMQAAAFSNIVPISGDSKQIRKLRFVAELHPDYPRRDPVQWVRRITPSEWRQLKATFRRVLVPQQAYVLTRTVCERASVGEVALELNLTEIQVVQLRSRAIRRMLAATSATLVKAPPTISAA